MGGLLFHVNSWISFIHCLIERRFYHPCCWTGYVGFSIQARFLNSVSAVLNLNSLCQFIFCINNLLPWEVISFDVFHHLFCYLDHAIQSFSVTLCSVILQSFSMFGFLSWPSHDIYRCLLIQIPLAILGDSIWDLSSGSLDGQCISPAYLCPSLTGHEPFLGGNPSSLSLVWWVCDQPSHEWLVSASHFLQLSLNVFMHWWRFAMEACVSMHPSSALLIALAIILSKRFATLFISDVISSQTSLSSNLVVGQQCTECDHEQSSLLFHLKRRDILSCSLGRPCPDPPCAVLSGTALPWP